MSTRFPAAALAGALAAAPCGAAAQSAAPAVDPAKAEAIRTLFAVTKTADLVMVNLGVTMAALGEMTGTPPGFQEAFMERVAADLPALLEALVPIYGSHLTTEEVEQLIAFYRTPGGQRFVEAQPRLTRESLLLSQQWGMSLVSEILADLAQAAEPPPVAANPAPPAPAVPQACDLGVERSLAMSTRLQPRNGGDGDEIWMQNHSNCTLRVTSVILYECENIRNTCDTSTRRNVDVRPGEDRLVLTVMLRDRGSRSTFRYRYQWEQVR